MKFTAITLSALITSVTATTIRKREGRKLQTGTAVEGPCTVENFNAAGVTSAQLTTALGNPADFQDEESFKVGNVRLPVLASSF